MSSEINRSLLSDKKRRMTRQRRVILGVLRSTDCHPDARWIYEQARRQIPHISLGTIYRTLKVLCDQGLARELRYGDQHSRYDGTAAAHGHVTCLHCDRITDVSLPQSEAFRRVAERESGFRIQSFRLEFEGLCPDCEQTQPTQRIRPQGN
jgi:Fur family transcriptional regulator, peroxide stress response regulator